MLLISNSLYLQPIFPEDPSSDELRRMLQRNGGSYEMYLSKTRVTHIVATNLPNSKFHMARTMPIVKPEWITDRSDIFC